MTYKETVASFGDEVWQPEDCTTSYWYRKWGELYYSEAYEESTDPDEWENSYSSDRVRQYVEQGGFVLVTLDDGCGGQYQAIFNKDKEIQVE